MNKLIEKDDCGNWSLKGIRWSNLMPGAVITKETYEKVYGALCKLMEYEDTGYTPEMVMDIARFAKKSHKQAMEYAIQIDGMQHWIPVSERLPEKDTECLIRYYNSKEGKRLTDIAWLNEEGNWQLIREAAGYFPRNFKKEITHWMMMSELYEPVCENP